MSSHLGNSLALGQLIDCDILSTYGCWLKVYLEMEKILNFYFKLFLYIFLYYFNILISKIIFYYLNIFLNKKYFKPKL
jgi:hypothetical protein